jgi:Mrp family chromosome partitioning ATPase
MTKEQQVLKQLEAIIDPDLNKDIVSLGFVKNLEITDDGDVNFDLELTTPACPVKEQFRTLCDEYLSELDWVRNVAVNMTAQPRRSAATSQAGSGLANVRHIIGVASCKGGVGKSTVAVNLAFTLSQMGAAVGIFDADIYGPSLPTLVAAPFRGLFQNGDQIIPVEHDGVKLMSFAYASEAGRPAIMRGPMVTQVINQLLTGTGWGELDYLIIDMPPGTGDIQLTVAQLVPMTAAVIVTTPQQISFVDVVKGIEMFDQLKIPTVAVVENMSYFMCGGCDTRHNIFGEGARAKLVNQYGFQNAIEIPVHADVSRLGDNGTPFVTVEPDSEIAEKYRELAKATVHEVSKVAHAAVTPEFSYQPDGDIVYRAIDGTEHKIGPADLRRRCKCARCIDEMSGKQILQPEQVADDITPQQTRRMGNYAVAIDWSDGHSSIYPYDALIGT